MKVANYTWTGTTSQNWATASNWSPAHVPSQNDTVTFTSNVTFSGAVGPFQSLSVTDGTVTFDGAVNTNNGNFSVTGGNITFGPHSSVSGAQNLKISSGTVTIESNDVHFNNTTVSGGQLSLNGVKSYSFTNTNFSGGTLELDNGATVESQSGNNFNGNAIILNNGSSLKFDSNFDAALTINGGSTASLTNNYNGGSVTFGSGSGNTLLLSPSDPNRQLPIYNVDSADKIGITGQTVTKASYTNSNGSGSITVTTTSGTYTYNKVNFAPNVPTGTHDADTSSGNAVVCFLAGSMIRTSTGDVAVENIQVGDEIVAFDWKNSKHIARTVVWVGKARATVRPVVTDDEAGWPVRILKDAIADGVPYKDMLITAEHCLFFRNRFVPVRMLVNGVSIFYDKTVSSYDYYHIETEQHSVITADGMLTESYLDTGNRSSFRQEGKVARLRSVTKNWEEDAGAPLNVERSFVEPLYRALQWREAWLESSASGGHSSVTKPELTNDPDLHLLTETGAVIRPIRQNGHTYNFMLPPETASVRIVSRASRPADVIGPFVDDRRYLGVAVTDVRLQCAKRQFDITAHLEAEKPAGWYATDTSDCAWTNGDAELPLGKHLTHGNMGILSITILTAGPYLLDTHQSLEAPIKSA